MKLKVILTNDINSMEITMVSMHTLLVPSFLDLACILLKFTGPRLCNLWYLEIIVKIMSPIVENIAVRMLVNNVFVANKTIDCIKLEKLF